MKKILLIAAIFSILSATAKDNSIVLNGKEASDKVTNSEVVRLKDFTKVPNYVRFRKGKELPFTKLESWLGQFYKTDAQMGVQLIKKETGKLGFDHYRYHQTINGIPAELSMFIVHVKNGLIHSLNGEFFSNVNSATTASLSEAGALTRALGHINATTYKWEIQAQEDHLKWEQEDPTATYYPKGELVLINLDGKVEGELKLAYKFNIYAEEPLSRRDVFVDATTGNIIWERDLIHEADVVGTASTLYSGSQTITCDNASGPFRLRETGRGNGVRTFTNNNTTTYSNTDITNGSTTWSTPDAGLDAHWGAEVTYDYFLNAHGRNSIDNAGFQLNSYVHHNNNYSNAFWDGSRMTYGDGSGNSTPFTAIDIAGHEVTHGLTSNTANLVYSYESGALNESFSDIFGISIDIINRPAHPNANWILGEDLGFIIRNMANPNSHCDPDTYLGTNWYTGSGDNGGVHTNSGVQNFWYVLLVDGGSGTNDNGDPYTVNSIGMTSAAEVAFRNLTVYLSVNSQYADARFFAIQSAVDLFGGCTNEVEQVTNAWYAVGVGPAYVASVVSDFDAPALTSCAVPFTVNFNNLSTNATTYNWDFGDGNTSTQSSPSNTYTTNGTFTVELIADGGLCGIDTVVKTSYIVISTPANPVTTDDNICINNTANLAASGAGTLNWYTNPTGGSPINTGTTYTTPVLSTTTSYYVNNVIIAPNQTMAKPDNTGGGANYNFDQHLKFDAFVNMEIISVVVYAGSAGNRTIELRDNAGTPIQSAVVNLVVGMQTVNLNFAVPAGTDHQLGVAGSTANIDMYRNDANVNYPYTLPGVASITRSSAGTNGGLNHYYFFYDWTVKEQDCMSPREPVTATVNPLPTVVANATSTTICDGDPVTLTGSGATSYSWDNSVIDGVPFNPSNTITYTVTGLDGNNCSNQDQITVTVNPLPTVVANATLTSICLGDPVTLTGSGANSYSWDNSVIDGVPFSPTVTTTYTVTGTDLNSCSNQDQIIITVNICTGVNELNENVQITSYFNTNNMLEIGLMNLKQGDYTLLVLNAIGQMVVSERIVINSSQQTEIVDVQSKAKGMYYVNLFNQKDSYTVKLVR